MKNNLLSVEDLPQVNFTEEEVHQDEKRRSVRSYNLRKAMKLGNLYKRKVHICFKTIEGMIKKVEVSVWAVGEEFVSLKAGRTIPIRSIDHVEF